MMPYMIILKFRKFHQSAINRFGTAGKNLWGGGAQCAPLSLNRVNTEIESTYQELSKNVLFVNILQLN